MAGSLAWNIHREHHNTQQTTLTAARTNIKKDISFRKWATFHGGVYVPPTKATPPNPYLKVPQRDVVTTIGKKLTLMNPAYMFRELQTDFSIPSIGRSHITSLKPINPGNVADAWETKALQSFEHGTQEVIETQLLNGQPYLRLMLPLPVEPGCLKCHAEQGYKVGDIRGGISTSVPLATYWQHQRIQNTEIALLHGLIWLIGLFMQSLSYRREYRLNSKRKQAEAKLRLSEHRARSLMDLTMRASSLNEAELLLSLIHI